MCDDQLGTFIIVDMRIVGANVTMDTHQEQSDGSCANESLHGSILAQLSIIQTAPLQQLLMAPGAELELPKTNDEIGA